MSQNRCILRNGNPICIITRHDLFHDKTIPEMKCVWFKVLWNLQFRLNTRDNISVDEQNITMILWQKNGLLLFCTVYLSYSTFVIAFDSHMQRNKGIYLLVESASVTRKSQLTYMVHFLDACQILILCYHSIQYRVNFNTLKHWPLGDPAVIFN